ncbi:polysaccharide chain length determinant protein, partial [mine drainage metagenome]
AAQQQDVIDKLRRNLDIVGYLAPQRASAALFTISYKDPDRARAEQVVGKLLDSFVQGTLFTKNQGSRQAVTFLNRQIAAYGKKLNGIEQQLASFQRRNIGLLPNTQGSHLTVNQTGAGALTVGMVQGQSGSYFGELQADLNALTRDRQRLYVAERTRAELAAELRAGQQFTVSAHGAPVASGAG